MKRFNITPEARAVKQKRIEERTYPGACVSEKEPTLAFVRSNRPQQAPAYRLSSAAGSLKDSPIQERVARHGSLGLDAAGARHFDVVLLSQRRIHLLDAARRQVGTGQRTFAKAGSLRLSNVRLSREFCLTATARVSLGTV